MSIKDQATSALPRARARWGWLDHLVRALGRYKADAGDRLAAAVTFFGFLSFFPLLALATSLLTYALGDEAVGTVVREVNGYAPGLADQLELEDLLTNNAAAAGTGLLGLAGLLYSGLGWVDALREAVRTVWHHNVQAGNLLVKKAKDVIVLAGLGATVVVSIGVSAATGAFTGFALDLVGLDQTVAAVALAKALGIALGLLTSTALFLYLFWRLPKVQSPLRRVLGAALLAGVLFEVLKRVGAFYIERTTDNPVYGVFAVVVGLLVWINIVSRMLLICAAWAVTAPYDSDVEPSGTASVRAARAAGVPTEFVSDDPDDRPSVLADGAPTPLLGALQGKPAAGGPSPAEGSAAELEPAAAVRRTAAGPDPRHEAAVRAAARVTAGVIGAGLVVVAAGAIGTIRSVLRRD